MVKFILSVDGGGIRGIIPAYILADIEDRISIPTAQIFDLLVGTSTGGIVVAGLCKLDEYSGEVQYSALDLIELYQQNGSFIFQSSYWRSYVSWLSGAQYPSENIESILHKYFGESTMRDVSSHLMLTSYDIHNNCPFFFKSWKEENHVKLKDALRATTAAPTYFEPKRLIIHELERVLVDGGIFANNPAACAYASAKILFPDDDLIMLSIGTGHIDKSIDYPVAKSLGRIQWIRPLLDMMFSSSVDAVNYQLTQVMGDRYIRIQAPLSIAAHEIDNTTSQNLRDLKQEADAIIESNQIVIDDFCELFKMYKSKFLNVAF